MSDETEFGKGSSNMGGGDAESGGIGEHPGAVPEDGDAGEFLGADR